MSLGVKGSSINAYREHASAMNSNILVYNVQ